MKLSNSVNGEMVSSIELSGFDAAKFAELSKMMIQFYQNYNHLQNVIRKDMAVIMEMARKYHAYGKDIQGDINQIGCVAQQVWPVFEKEINSRHSMIEAMAPFVEGLTHVTSFGVANSYNHDLVVDAFGMATETFEVRLSLDEAEEAEFGLGLVKRMFIRAKTGLIIEKVKVVGQGAVYYIELPVHNMDMYMALLTEGEALIRIAKIIDCGVKGQESYIQQLRASMNS